MQPSRRRKFVTRAVVCVVAGVVLSFVSALPVLWVRYPGGDFNGDFAYGQKYGVRMFVIPGDSKRTEAQSRFAKPWWTFAAGMDDTRIGIAGEVGVGMPLPILNGGTIFIMNPDGTVDETLRRGFVLKRNGAQIGLEEGIPDPLDSNTQIVASGLDQVVPTRVIWRGLIGNTIFYGVIAWLIIALLGWCRRAIRSRRGQCEGCAYSLEGLDAGVRCPECGGERKAPRHQAIEASS